MLLSSGNGLWCLSLGGTKGDQVVYGLVVVQSAVVRGLVSDFGSYLLTIEHGGLPHPGLGTKWHSGLIFGCTWSEFV